MTYSDLILPEFDEEMANTRKVLERVPEDQLEWRIHPKSNTMGWIANHIAEIPGWVDGTINGTEWDFSPPGGPAYQTPSLTSVADILAMFDANVVTARRAFAAVKDESMSVPWTLKYQGDVIFTMPRSSVIRSFVLNHMIHHRAILCVNLRMKNIPVPGMYGPSGDEG